MPNQARKAFAGFVKAIIVFAVVLIGIGVLVPVAFLSFENHLYGFLTAMVVAVMTLLTSVSLFRSFFISFDDVLNPPDENS